MKNNIKYILTSPLHVMMLVMTLLFVAGCGGGSDVDTGEKLLTCELPLIPNAEGTACVEPPPLQCPPPTVPNATNDACVVGADPNAPTPVVTPAADEAILFYNRIQDGTSDAAAYEGWKLHTWNNPAGCDSYAPESIAPAWDDGLVIDGVDPNYGAYWILKLKEDYNDCGNFIIHIGTDDAGKEMGGADFQMNLVQDDPDFVRMNFTISNVPSVFEYPITSLGELPLQIADYAAHWIDATTLVWDVDAATLGATSFQLHYSPDASIEADENDNLTGSSLALTAGELSEAQLAMYPQYEGWVALTGTWSADDAKGVLKNQLAVAAYDAESAVAATWVQAAKVLDDIYTSGDNDANEASLGPVYSDSGISANLWAPTAQSVTLHVYDAGKTLQNSYAMTEDAATGIWSHAGDAGLDRMFYQYELTVYHPQNNAIETVTVTDPYSVSLSTNGVYSQFVNLADDDLKPVGWEGHTVATIVDPEDAVIYEGHVRDFSARDMSTSEANRGKYMAFTETGSAPMTHLANLAATGVTHFHLLPTNDIASINEDPETIVDITDTVADLCAVNENAPVCGVESDSATLLSVFESYQPFSEDAQALTESMRNYDSFNWGYDPKHYNAPDGIYASDADGVARILEKRAMVMALHDIGLRVVMDVVYNHTNASGLFDNSVLDKVVPGYYHRRDLITGGVQRSTCCDDTSLENVMMDKLMVDSLIQWADQYMIDGFRFDIMSHGSVDQMLAARDAVQAVDPDNYFYGEGWFRGDGRADQANQENMAGTEIATFNDRLREGIRTGALFNEDGSLQEQDVVKLGMAGTLANYVLESSGGTVSTGSSFSRPSYALDPADVVNYVSKHDDNTLWDQLQYVLPFGTPLEDRVRAQNIAISIPLMSQGIPFLQMGGDMIRSKSMDRNTYDAGDWFNLVDFTMMTNNWNVGLPLAQDNGGNWATINGLSSNPLAAVSSGDIMFANSVFNEFLSIRSASKLFRLTTEADVLARVGFHNLGSRQTQGLIVMSIDDGIGVDDLDPMNDAIVVVVNASDNEESHTIPTAAGFELHPTQVSSVDATVTGASFSAGDGEGTFTVPAKTMAVFVKPQGDMQGEGLSAYATAGLPDVVPYGDTAIYLRGGMNDWGTADQFTYQGDGVYDVAIAMTGGTRYEFKVASEDWSTVDFGNPDGEVIEGEDKVLQRGGTNLNITPSIDATYLFSLFAGDTEAPILNVVNEEPFVGTPVYLRGGMNGWGETDEMVYQGGRIYEAAIDITAGDYEFKVASSDWATVNLGAENSDEADVELGVEELLFQTNDNLRISLAEDATYLFIFDMVNLEPKLRVFNQQFFGATPVFLRGGMNGWGTDDEVIYNGDGTYSVDIAIVAGDYEFKVASEDWSAVNFGAENGDEADVELGVAKPLFVTNDNLRLSITADGTYRFTVVGPDATQPSVIVTAQ